MRRCRAPGHPHNPPKPPPPVPALPPPCYFNCNKADAGVAGPRGVGWTTVEALVGAVVAAVAVVALVRSRPGLRLPPPSPRV